MLRNAARAALERLPRGASDGQGRLPCPVLRVAAERVGVSSRKSRHLAANMPRPSSGTLGCGVLLARVDAPATRCRERRRA